MGSKVRGSMYEGVCVREVRRKFGLGFWENLSLSNAQELLFQFHTGFIFSSSSSNDPQEFILRVLIIHSVSSIFWFLFVISITVLIDECNMSTLSSLFSLMSVEDMLLFTGLCFLIHSCYQIGSNWFSEEGLHCL